MGNQDIRWVQRFENFHRAFALLREIVEESNNILELRPIVKEGIIQRFEYTFELAWKTLKDKMEHDGIVITKLSPKHVFKIAFDQVLRALQDNYYPQLDILHSYRLEEQLQK